MQHFADRQTATRPNRGPYGFIFGVVATAAFSTLVGAAEVTLDNGVGGDGHIQITTGVAGAWQDNLFGTPEWNDFFDPGLGSNGENPAENFSSFFAAFFLHVDIDENDAGTAGNHIVLTDPLLDGGGGIPDTYNAPGGANFGGASEMNLEVVSENTTDQLPMSSSSQFRVTGDCTPFVGCNINIGVDLAQSIGTGDPGPNGEVSGFIDQTITLRNEDDVPHTIVFQRHMDIDMPFVDAGGQVPNAINDRVGMDRALLGYPVVYAEDSGVNTAALILSTTEDPMNIPGTTGFYYYMIKGTIDGAAGNQCSIAQPPSHPTLADGPNCPADPGCGGGSGSLCPPNDFGSDFQWWERAGIPNCWKNWVPGVGRDLPGQSPAGAACEAGLGLQVELTLEPAGSELDTYTITFRTTYGFRPIPPRFGTPAATAELVEFDADTGCAEFLYTVVNNNPGGDGLPDDLESVYVDIEAGIADPTAPSDCRADIVNNITAPEGYEVAACTSFDANGHALARLDLVNPVLGIESGGLPGIGRIKVNTNGLESFTNPDTGISVPPLSVVLSFAQDHPERGETWTEPTCGSFDFGPAVNNGLWSPPVSPIAFLPVPSLSESGKAALALVVIGVGVMLVARGRRTAAA